MYRPRCRLVSADAHGRLAAVILPEVLDPATDELVAPRYEYGYDTFGNQTLIRDPLGRETRFAFDSEGRQISRTLPLGFGADGIEGTADDTTLPEGDFTERMQYDSLGRQSLAISFEGVVTQFVYSEETGRLTEQRFFANLAAYDDGEGTPGEVWSFTYDAFGREIEVTRAVTGGSTSTNSTAYDAQGRVVRIESPEGIVSYAYDLFGRKTKTMLGEAGAPTSETRYRYDALGRLDFDLGREAFRLELKLFATSYSSSRPHTWLGGRSPDEVHYALPPANAQPRIEPHARWPLESRRAHLPRPARWTSQALHPSRGLAAL